jgi:serine phosphatase RsbU (regulator of sigma subunit)
MKQPFYILLFLFSHILTAQNKSGSKQARIDSLNKVLINLTPASGEFASKTIKGQSLSLEKDTIRIKTLNALAWELRNTNPDTAIILCTEALALANKYINYSSTSSETQGRARNSIQKLISKSYIQLGAFNHNKGNFDFALEFNHKALSLWEQLKKDTLLNSKSEVLERSSIILGNLGSLYTDQGDYSKALDYCFKALKLAEELGDKNVISGRFTNIGNIYHHQAEHQKALDYYSKALKLAEETGNKPKIATNLSNIGITYRNLGDFDKTLDYHFRALKIDEELENENQIARHFINIAGGYYGKEDFFQALTYNSKALEIYEKQGNKSGIATASGNIGSIYTHLKNYKEAETFLLKAIAVSTEIKALGLMKDHEQYLYKLYDISSKPAKALEHYKKYTAIKDSIFNEENTKKTVRSELNFEFEKKRAIARAEQEKHDAIAHKEKQKQRIMLLLVTCFLIIVIVFALFMFNRWRITKRQKAIIEKQKENIVDSITYAQLIQQSILPEENEIKKYIPDFFIFYQPKDIVSGDFYWFSTFPALPSGEGDNSGLENTAFLKERDREGRFMIAAIDCTGHGVPGAFMSMIGNTLLNQIVNEKYIVTPSEILYHLNLGIYEVLNQKRNDIMSGDGMDIALCCIDFEKQQIQYAGAQNSLYILIDGELQVIEADKQSIGSSFNYKPINPVDLRFTNHTIPIKSGMSIYLFTDGYKDQFAEKKKEKFGKKRFKELIINNPQLSMKEQKEIFVTNHVSWKGSAPQTDDILVLGIKF